jgi:hypothetical protein
MYSSGFERRQSRIEVFNKKIINIVTASLAN